MLPIEHLKKSNTKENLWLYILSLLGYKSEIYAWKLPLLVQENFGFKPGKITPYRVLYRLENDGLVKSELKEKRRIYKITKKGEEELKKAIKFYQYLLKNLK